MVIIDACVAAKLFIAEADSHLAEQVFACADVLIAPDLILIEVGNALFKSWRAGTIDAEHMDMALSRLPTLFGRLHPTGDLVADAAIVARILRHPIPDCVYATLAWRTGTKLVTADLAFQRALVAVAAWSDIAVSMQDFIAT